MKKLFVFDLDGTLIDSAADISAAANHARTALGLDPLSVDIIRSYVGRGVVRLLEDVFQTKDKETIQKAVATFLEFYREHLLDQTLLYPDVEKVLQDFFQKGTKLAVLSNKPQAFSERIVHGLHVAHLFCDVIGGDTALGRKPDPAGLKKIMKAAGASNEETVFVGDSLVDWETGQNAGVETALLTYGFSSAASLRRAGANHLFDSFADLAECYKNP